MTTPESRASGHAQLRARQLAGWAQINELRRARCLAPVPMPEPEPAHTCSECLAVARQVAAVERGLEQVVNNPHRTAAAPPLVCEP